MRKKNNKEVCWADEALKIPEVRETRSNYERVSRKYDCVMDKLYDLIECVEEERLEDEKDEPTDKLYELMSITLECLNVHCDKYEDHLGMLDAQSNILILNTIDKLKRKNNC